jgi:hypothetical protein
MYVRTRKLPYNASTIIWSTGVVLGFKSLQSYYIAKIISSQRNIINSIVTGPCVQENGKFMYLVCAKFDPSLLNNGAAVKSLLLSDKAVVKNLLLNDKSVLKSLLLNNTNVTASK